MNYDRKDRPDIVDNVSTNMIDALNLNIPKIKSLDISSGYFELSGYDLIRNTLEPASEKSDFVIRLLLGEDAISAPVLNTFEDYRKKIKTDETKSFSTKSLGENLDDAIFTQDNMNSASSLVKMLKRNNIQVRHNDRRFNHAKCYILGKDMALVGSSNFTKSGFEGNRELNAAIYTPASLDKIYKWFNRMWFDAKDTKQEIIDLLEQSKFGIPPNPYQIYIKMLFEKYKPSLMAMAETDSSKLANLAKFQKDAVITTMHIINDYRGVIIADSTGLGKTHIGIEIIRQKRHQDNKKVLLIAPSQVLESVWKVKLESAGITIKTITMESLGRDTFEDELHKYRNIDTVVIDESQNFRSKNANRRINLMKLMSGKKKDAILLSATPINNSIMDLYYQVSIITNGDDTYFSNIGIPDLYQHMRKAANEGIGNGLQKIQQLLDAIMIRRTRSFIKDVYPNEKLNGKLVKFPKREYSPIYYDLSETTGTNVYSELLDTVEKLHMVPYGVETYNKTLSKEEREKHKVLATLQTIIILKRFESSTYAAKISIDNKIRLYEHFEKTLKNNSIVSVKELNKIMAKWKRQTDGEDDGNDRDEFFVSAIEKLPTEPAANYDTVQMKVDLTEDLRILREYQKGIEEILPFDKKFDAVAEKIMIDGALKNESKKVLIFTEYTATANHIKKKMMEKFGNKKILLITGDVNKETRQKMIQEFSPKANMDDDETMPKQTADILISTEVLAEGQNLQDCNYVINYDLPWNPMRIVQRIGRIDRLTSTFDTVRSRECYPEKSLDKILKLMGKLLGKIETINDVIGLDTSILGAETTPKQFNGTDANRIRIFAGASKSEDSVTDVREKLERESDLMPLVSPLNEINQYVKKTGIEEMMKIPMGRRSGKNMHGDIVIISYIQEKPQRQFHSVLFDYSTRKAEVIEDSDAFKHTACVDDTPKYMPMDDNHYSRSFAELLEIDKLARNAIIYKKSIDADAANRLRQTSNTYRKNIEKIQGIIMEAVSDGKVSKKEGGSVFEIADSPDLKAWENNISDLLKEYDKTKNVADIMNKIKKIAERVGIEKEVKQKIKQDKNPILILVGAMFITGDKPVNLFHT